MKKSKTGGAAIDQVGALHELTVRAAVLAIEQAITAGEISPALLTAALRICSDSGVSATVEDQEELFRLNSMLAGLNLDTTVSKREYSHH